MSFCVVPSVEQVTALGAKKVSKGRFLVHSLDTCASLLPKYPGTKDWETHDAETALGMVDDDLCLFWGVKLVCLIFRKEIGSYN